MPIVKTHISDSELFHDLKAMGRDNFSYDGAKALTEYLEQLSEDIGENIEYDPIAFCCDFAEYLEKEFQDLAAEYSNHDDCPQADDYDDIDDFKDDLVEWLQEQTTVIEFNGGLIIQAF